MHNLFYKIPLGELVLIQKGEKPAILKKKPFQNSIPYLDINALENRVVNHYTEEGITYQATEKDLLVVWDGARSGLVFKGEKGSVGSTLMRLTPIGIDQNYLYYFIKTKFEYINGNTTGTGIPHVNSEIFFDLEVPYTSIKNQEIIIDKLLNTYKQSSIFITQQKENLKSALMETNIDFQFDAESIDISIQNFQKTVLEKAIYGQLTNENIDSFNNKNKVQSIPKSWEWNQLSDICSQITDGDHQSPKKVKVGVPFIVISNIKNGKINLDDTSYVTNEYFDSLQDYKKPKINDILISVVGTIGNAAIVDNDQKFCFQRHIALLRPGTHILSKYLYYIINSAYFISKMNEYAKGDAQLTLNLTNLRLINVPVPPIDEQEKIVKIIEDLFSISEDIKKNYEKSIDDLSNLEKAVLEATFDDSNINWENNNTNILEALGKEKQALKEKRRENRKTQTLNKEIAVSRQNKIRTLEEIIIDNNKNVSIEELWQQSSYFNNDNVEEFYDELISIKNLKVIFEDENKLTTLVKLP